MLFRSLALVIATAVLVAGHAEPSTPFDDHPVEIARRQLETNKRHVMARNCAPQVAEYQAKRKARRDLIRRGLDPDEHMENLEARQATGTSSAAAPHYSTIQNFTCVTAPEVTEGPYYLRDDYVRQDVREGQPGTPLYLDIGVLDIATCQPAKNVFVEIWACNAQGLYAAFPATLPTGGTFPPPGGGFGIGKVSADNFLRGGYPANENGVAELLTIYPGFYTGRTIHVHVMVHQNITTHSNGTIISSSNSLRHIGQIFFDEALNDEVVAQAAYKGSINTRMYNSQDSILTDSNKGGYSAYAKVERLGSSLSDGLLGYITIGIDTTAHRQIITNNYWDPNFKPSKRDEEHE